jgi:DNA-binding LytR/AlgR family response regulator
MMVYVTIKSLEEQLPAGVFIKVHKSFIVNINKVKYRRQYFDDRQSKYPLVKTKRKGICRNRER